MSLGCSSALIAGPRRGTSEPRSPQSLHRRKEMLQVEEFYQVLLWAERIAPESDPSDPRSLLGSLRYLLLETADQIAKELDPKAPSDIRSYRNIEDCRIVEAMLYHLVEQSKDREHDGLPRFWAELGRTNVLN